MYRLFGLLVARIEALLPLEKCRWKGFHLLCADKTTLSLPDWPELWKKFGCHKVRKHLGPVGVEFCCLFSVFTRAPLAFSFGKSCTSEDRLFARLVRHVRKRTVLLLDNGFYSFAIFETILAKLSHFVIPASVSLRPKYLKKLGDGDYLAEIICSRTKRKMTVRVIYAYRKGFRRKRIVTSLLDPVRFPAAEIVSLYHLRWTVETFYRDFKSSMKANAWHCQKIDSFEKELVSKLIAVCLVRLSAVAAADSVGLMPSRISFAKVLEEVRLFMRKITSQLYGETFESCIQELIAKCAKFLIDIRPGRSFPRDKQIYRRISRGLVKKRRGRPTKIIYVPEPPGPEVLTMGNCAAILLS